MVLEWRTSWIQIVKESEAHILCPLHLYLHFLWVVVIVVVVIIIIHIINFSSSLDWFYIMLFTLVRCKLPWISIVWNSIASADVNKQEPIQQKSAVLSFVSFPLCPLQLHLWYRILEIVAITWRGITLMYPLLLLCPSLLKTAGLLAASQYIRDYFRFSVY